MCVTARQQLPAATARDECGARRDAPGDGEEGRGRRATPGERQKKEARLKAGEKKPAESNAK